MEYPRVGEAIVPRLLRPLVIGASPAQGGDADGDLINNMDLGPEAWTRLPPETCRRLSLLVVDRVQARMRALPDLAMHHPLPEPRVALTLPIERRTANAIRREAPTLPSSGAWTVERYLGLRRFGGRALVDLLAATEAQLAPAADGTYPPPNQDVPPASRTLAQAIAVLLPRLPMPEHRAYVELARQGLTDAPLDLRRLARLAVKHGHDAPFHVVELGEARILVRHGEVAAAHAAYRLALRTAQGWGLANVLSVAGRVAMDSATPGGAAFVERVLTAVPRFRWLDRPNGWFWFMPGRNPLVDDLRKVFSIRQRITADRLWAALFRHRPGPPFSAAAVREVCTALPGATVAGGVVSLPRALHGAGRPSELEARVTRLLADAPTGLSASQIRAAIRPMGLPWTSVHRLLRFSPLVERPADDLYRLVGGPAANGP